MRTPSVLLSGGGGGAQGRGTRKGAGKGSGADRSWQLEPHVGFDLHHVIVSECSHLHDDFRYRRWTGSALGTGIRDAAAKFAWAFAVTPAYSAGVRNGNTSAVTLEIRWNERVNVTSKDAAMESNRAPPPARSNLVDSATSHPILHSLQCPAHEVPSHRAAFRHMPTRIL